MKTASTAWMFLGVRVTELTPAGSPVVVAEAHLPKGASPPAHRHEALDDSFYIVEGTMVIRCGEEVSVGRAGTWVQFPRGRPHTFRVMSEGARILLVHANRTFMDAVRAIGRPADAGDTPAMAGGPSADELRRLLAEHDIHTVGPSLEEGEAAVQFRAQS